MSQNTQKSKTPTSSSIKSNRFSKLLKKKKKRKKSKSSKSHHHLDIQSNNDHETPTPPVLRHRTTSPPAFIPTTTNMNNIERYHSSTCSEHDELTLSPQTHTQLRNTRSLSQYDHPKLNITKRNIPPPPPKTLSHHNIHKTNKNKHKSKRTPTASYQQQHRDSNININIDINKTPKNHQLIKRSSTRRSRHNSIDTDSPISPSSPQSPAAKFISHMPRESIENKINIKQLLYEMIEMKRQIKSLKKDVKYLKTENDLSHRRITFLEQTLDNKNINKHKYNHTEINLHPQSNDTLTIMGQMNLGPSQIQNIQTRPKRLSLTKQTHIHKHTQHIHVPNMIERSSSLNSMQSSEIEPVELDLNENNMDTKLRKLSQKLSNTNVFSNEYRRLEYELNTLVKQQNEENIDQNNYYDDNNEEYNEYNDETIIIHKGQNEKRLYSVNDDQKDKYVNNRRKSVAKLSRRTTKGYNKNIHVEKQIVHKYSNDNNDSAHGELDEYPSMYNCEGMEIINID